MTAVRLPDCSEIDRGPILSSRQRRELVRVLAEEGPEGLEAWIRREEEDDPRIRERIEEVREKIEREARRRKRKIEQQYEQEAEQVDETWSSKESQAQQREEQLRSEMTTLKGGPTAQELAQHASGVEPLLDPEASEPTLWEKIKGFFLRIWLAIVESITRFVAWIRGEELRDEEAVIDLGDVEVDLPELRKTNPGVIARVRKQDDASIGERIRDWWNRLRGREDYSSRVQELMERELEQAREKAEKHRESERQELEAELESASEERSKARREKQKRLRKIEQKREEKLAEIEEQVDHEPLEEVRRELQDELIESGLLGEDGTPTEGLLQRFSSLLYEEVQRALPHGGRVRPGAFVGGEGQYEKGPLRSLNERGAAALSNSVVRARENHPTVNRIYDDDLIVRREVRSTETHVVIVFDKSGSMEEKGRFEAAKRVCLVMHQAVRDHDPRHTVDILSMGTDVEPVSLTETWNAELGGFTNQAEALLQARDLLKRRDADRKLVYLITDGLPEAYPGEDGEPVVDQPAKCMGPTLEAAESLGELEDMRLTILQLETEDELYLDAAREIAEAAGGRMEGLDPRDLTEEVVLDFEVQTHQR